VYASLSEATTTSRSASDARIGSSLAMGTLPLGGLPFPYYRADHQYGLGNML
jgi:hypothetical protein